MRAKTTKSGHSRRFLATSLTMTAILTATRLAGPARAYAAPNLYQWTKQVDQDLLGGTYSSVASSADGSHLIIS